MRALLVLLVACAPKQPTYVRYIDVPLDRPATVRAVIAERARERKIPTLETDVYTAGAVNRPETLTVRAWPQGAGSLLEITSTTGASLNRLATGGRTYHAPEERLVDPLYLGLVIDAGIAHAPHTDAWWRIDPTAQLGVRVWASDATRTLAPRHRLSIVAGLGAAIDDRVAFRPELGIAFDRQDAIARIDGRMFRHGPRKSISLAFSTPLAPDYIGYEGSVTLHVPPFGGVFGRVGYETGDRGDGMTYMFGMRLDDEITSLAMGGALGAAAQIAGALALIYLLSQLDLRPNCEKNGSCD